MTVKTKKVVNTVRTEIRAPDGSSFIKCDKCNKDVHVAFLKTHGCAVSETLIKSLVVTVSQPVEKEVKRPANDVAQKSEAVDHEEAPKSKKPKSEVTKDDNDAGKPKRAMTPYFIYMNEVRNQLKAENPSLNNVEIVKLMGEKWQAMPVEEKKVYQEKADADKKRYQDDVASGVVAPAPSKSKKTQPSSAKTGDESNKPKKPLTAYFIFSGELRATLKEENPGISVTELSKLLGEKWKALSDDEKKVYVAKAAGDKKRYARELAIFEGREPPADDEDDGKESSKADPKKDDEEMAERKKDDMVADAKKDEDASAEGKPEADSKEEAASEMEAKAAATPETAESPVGDDAQMEDEVAQSNDSGSAGDE